MQLKWNRDRKRRTKAWKQRGRSRLRFVQSFISLVVTTVYSNVMFTHSSKLIHFALFLLSCWPLTLACSSLNESKTCQISEKHQFLSLFPPKRRKKKKSKNIRVLWNKTTTKQISGSADTLILHQSISSLKHGGVHLPKNKRLTQSCEEVGRCKHVWWGRYNESRRATAGKMWGFKSSTTNERRTEKVTS